MTKDFAFCAHTFDEISEEACEGTLYEGKRYSDLDQHNKLFDTFVEQELGYFVNTVPGKYSFPFMSVEDRNVLIATADIVKRRSAAKNALNLCVNQLDMALTNYITMLTRMQLDNQTQLGNAQKHCQEIFERYRDKVWIEKKWIDWACPV